MKMKLKRGAIVGLTAVAGCFAMLGALGVSKAQADDEQAVFSMYRTASVRFAKNDSEKTGIRFGAKINKKAFQTFAGEDKSIVITFEVDKAGNVDAGEAESETYTITENDFAAKNEIEVTYSILFNLTEAEIAVATAMPLEAKCYVATAGAPIYAENCTATQGVVQDMRAVANFNALQPTVTGDLTAYYGEAKTVEGTASYLSGTLGVKIDLGEEIGNDKTVYINTTRIDNATVAGTCVTVAKEDMPELFAEADNYVQIFDANNNVTVKKLTETAVAKSVENFSAMDGDFNAEEILGENVTVNAVETLSNSAVTDGEFATLAFTDNKLTGLQTSGKDWTNAVVRMTTDYTVYDVNVKAATKIIDEAEDLKVFTVKPAEVAEGAKGHGTIADGFYALTKDIDASNLSLDEHSGYQEKWYPTLSVDKGLTGTLDGQGHTISNLTAKGEGLFSIVNGGTIKNIGFVNGKVEAAANKYAAFFAHKMLLAELSNVYVHVTSINSKDAGKPFNSVLTYSTMHKVKMTNVVVEYAQTAFEIGEYYASLGLIDGKKADNQGVWSNVYAISSAPLASDEGHLTVASNQKESEVTALKDKFLAGQTVTTLALEGVKSYASKALMATDSNTLTAFESKYWTVKNGVPYWNGVEESAYLSAEDFAVKATTDGEDETFKKQASFAITDTLGNELPLNPTLLLVNTADGECVTIEGNVLKKNENYTVSEDREIAVAVTATVGDLTVEKEITVTLVQNFDDYNKVTLDKLYIEADGTLVGLSEENQTALENVTYKTALKGTEIDFADGKLATDFLAEVTLGDNGSIVAISEDTVYTLNYRYVTKAISNADGLKAFQAVSKGTYLNEKDNKEVSSGTYAIEGYYVLTDNINANGLTLAHGKFYNNLSYPNASNDGGFKGTFDGQGYTISNLTTPNTGLFSQIFGGTVKNVGFVNVAFSSGDYKTVLGQRVYDATIENVYIQVKEVSNKVYVLACQELLRSTLTNVIIDMPTPTTMKAGEIYGIANFSGRQYFSQKGTWTNVYVLTDMPFEAGKKELYVNSAWGWYDYLVVAENATEAQITEYWKLGVYSDTLEDYPAVVLSGVKSYADSEAMADAVSESELASFEQYAQYWDTTSGAPVWVTAQTANA